MSEVMADFHLLVRGAADALDGFDNWDKGSTYYSSDVRHQPILCSLEHVLKDLRDANRALIQFVIENSLELIAENEDG